MSIRSMFGLSSEELADQWRRLEAYESERRARVETRREEQERIERELGA